MRSRPSQAHHLVSDSRLHSVITRTANAPQVTILSPTPGATLGVTTTVVWVATDADGDPLVAFVEYSHDEGTTIVPLSKPLTDTSSIVINSDKLPASDEGSITIRVTDGLNTTVASVGSLEVGPDKPPVAFIVAPPDGKVYEAGRSALLAGSAHDPEDGPLFGQSLRWMSSRDGFLGYGETIEVALSSGQHVITFEATDSALQTATDAITITQQ